MKAKGINCEVELFDHHILIKRTGLFAAGSRLGGDKSVPLSSITSVQFRRAGMFSPGFIKFGILGEADPGWDKLIHPNVVGFRSSQQMAFLRIRDAIQASINVPSLAALAADHMRNRIGNSSVDDRENGLDAATPRLEHLQPYPPNFDDIPPWQPRSPAAWWRDLSWGSKTAVAAATGFLLMVIVSTDTKPSTEADPTVQYVDESGNTTSAPEARKPVVTEAEESSQSAQPSLIEHVGKYPSDEIRGTSFWRQPAVMELVGRVTPDHTMAKMILDGGTEGKISQNGEWIRAYSCMPHNCGSLNWSVIIKADGKAGTVCYHNDDDNRDGWYNDVSVEENGGNCMPSQR